MSTNMTSYFIRLKSINLHALSTIMTSYFKNKKSLSSEISELNVIPRIVLSSFNTYWTSRMFWLNRFCNINGLRCWLLLSSLLLINFLLKFWKVFNRVPGKRQYPKNIDFCKILFLNMYSTSHRLRVRVKYATIQDFFYSVVCFDWKK